MVTDSSPVDHGEAHRLVEGGRKLLEVGEGDVAQAGVAGLVDGEDGDGRADPVDAVVVAAYGVEVLERGEQPGRGRGGQTGRLGEGHEATRAVRHLPQQGDGALDTLYTGHGSSYVTATREDSQ